MIKSALLDTLNKIWPMITIFVVVLASIRIVYFIYNKEEKFILYKELTSLLFVVYVLFLFYIVTFQENNYGFSNYVPFKEIFRHDVSSRLFFRNVIGNILLFSPLGWFITYYVKTSKVYATLILSILISFSIELTQLNIGRVFDIDDIILNVFGGVLGYIFYMILYKVKIKLPKVLQSVWFLNICIIVIFILFILYLTNWYKFILGA